MKELTTETFSQCIKMNIASWAITVIYYSITSGDIGVITNVNIVLNFCLKIQKEPFKGRIPRLLLLIIA